ncbi:MAG TPA: hypothetical protein VJ981_01380 [Gammaproteobacteria bacterium]|nr:hypothetical protein [Gammaproteobacteria bacterium]
MNRFTPDPDSTRDYEKELQTLMELCDKKELCQCIRLMAVYLALYKKSYGELPPGQVEEIQTMEKMDMETVKLFDYGFREAIDIVTLVLQSQVILYPDHSTTIN